MHIHVQAGNELRSALALQLSVVTHALPYGYGCDYNDNSGDTMSSAVRNSPPHLVLIELVTYHCTLHMACV